MQGAEEMAQMEHLMNVYASKAAKGGIAEFLGYCEVAASEANYRLTEGLWLVSSNGSSSRGWWGKSGSNSSGGWWGKSVIRGDSSDGKRGRGSTGCDMLSGLLPSQPQHRISVLA